MSHDGDRLTEAFRLHGADLLRYFQRRSPEDAPDLLGAAMLVAWRRMPDAPTAAHEMRLWLYGIARTTLRGRRRDTARGLRLVERLRTVATIPEDHDDALALDVRRAIAALPHEQRELVELVHWDGLTIADAAQVLNINASTARSRYAKARESLAATLASALI